MLSGYSKSKREMIEHFGVKLVLDSTFMSGHMIEVIRNKQYENTEANEIKHIIQSNEVILEIGAGIGFITNIMAKNEFSSKIISYEANPYLIRAIKDNLRHNLSATERKKVVLRNAVLLPGTLGGKMDFYIAKDFWASSLESIDDPVRVKQVEVDNFNVVVAKERPTMIVCDIEGGELALFQNADLTGVKKVFIELHQSRYGRLGMKKIFESFLARDFHYDQYHSRGSVVLFSHLNR